MEEVPAPGNMVELTAEIISAYVANNHVSKDNLVELMGAIHGALTGLAKPAEKAAPPPDPAISIKKSVTPDYIVCLEDGKRFKSLKRHLRTAYGMTPEAYRAKWNLPADYPMVAPSYAASRSALAKSMGLGQARRERGASTAPEPAVVEAVPEPAPRKRAPGKKSA